MEELDAKKRDLGKADPYKRNNMGNPQKPLEYTIILCDISLFLYAIPHICIYIYIYINK